MKKQWLYNENGGELFEGEEVINNALKKGYVDTPAKLGKVEPQEGDSSINEVNDEPNYDVSIDELKAKYTIKQLKSKCKDLGIVGMSRKSTDECTQAIFNHYNENSEDL